VFLDLGFMFIKWKCFLILENGFVSKFDFVLFLDLDFEICVV